MKGELFPKNFLTLQEPPVLKITERRDGALVIDPPSVGGAEDTTHIGTETAAGGSITKSDTETHGGTSTSTETATSTSGAVTLSTGDTSFPIRGARIDAARPQRYLREPDLSSDSFEVVEPIPKGSFEDESVEPRGELRIRDVSVTNLIQPDLDGAKPSFQLPDLGRPWDGADVEASDTDNDDDGDQDDVPDSDNDNDSDDETDSDHMWDEIDAKGYDAVRKHVRFKPPLAGGGTEGRLER